MIPPPHKNAPPPDQNVNLPTHKIVPPSDQSLKSPPPNINSHPLNWRQKKKMKISGKLHQKYRSTLTTYSSGQRPSPAKCRSMVLCLIWRKWDKAKRKERCLSLSWTNSPVRLLSPPKTAIQPGRKGASHNSWYLLRFLGYTINDHWRSPRSYKKKKQKKPPKKRSKIKSTFSVLNIWGGGGLRYQYTRSLASSETPI